MKKSALDKNTFEAMDSSRLLYAIDQKFHNLGVSKNLRHSELIKIVIAKLYDEKQNTENPFFKTNKNEADNETVNKIHQLFKNALNFYNLESIEAIKLDEKTLVALVRIFETLSLSNANHSLMQDIFMRFGPQFLKMDLDQYFTPTEIVDFVTSVLNLRIESRITDPAGGSADFLVSAYYKIKETNLFFSGENLYYFDNSPDAKVVASLNTILNNSHKSRLIVIDSIESYDYMAGSFDFCLTNPPFGTRTIWAGSLDVMNHYDLGHKWKNNVMGSDVFRQQLGILFIERGMKLLKNNGILAIVLPNGYLTNPSESYLREWLLKNYRILGVIDLPAGTFKKSGTGVSPVLLFVENRKSLTDYKIFTAVAHAVGFNFRSKLNEKMYKRNPETGVYFTNSKGELIPENDLVKISFEFKNFAFEEHIQKMNCENSGLSYDFIMKSDLQRDPYLVLAPKRREKNYLQLINSLNYRGAKTLKQIGAKIVKKQDKIDETKDYYYLDISQIGAGKYVLENKIYGWNLPGRAKQLAKIGDIFVSRLNGSSSKFCIIVDDIDNIIVTNGMFKLIFKDEKQKFNFFHFLSTAEFSIQFNALATGSIMEDVKDVDLENMLLIPQSNIEENHLIIKRFLSLVLETNNLLK